MKRKKKYTFFKTYVEEGEKILYVAHKHILILKVKGAKTSFFGIVIPGILFILFPKLFFFWSIWLLVGLGGMLYNFIDWYYDVWILTNQGVVDLKSDGFFDMTTTRIDYHMIEGTSYTIKGFWRTLFNFGDITVDKIGAKTSVKLIDAADPKGLERRLMEYQERYVNERSVRDHQVLKGMLSDMISYHIQNGKLPGKD